jgi:protoporphyrin/coproporphyrin ferrochelatase
MAYDAFVLVSFGGPEGPDDVMPFLRNVTRGRGIPEDRLAAVAEHYHHFGGVSPINQQCRDLIAALEKEFAGAGVELPIYWGNRNWDPHLAETVRQMREDGIGSALAFVTSPYGSYSSCRQYLDDIDRARAQVGPGAPAIDKIRHYHDHPGHIAGHADGVRAALAELPPADPATTRLVFTAHSIPSLQAATSGPGGGTQRYVTQLREAAALVAAAAAPGLDWDLVWQSRSGPPQMPWLEPDINDHLRTLAAGGVRAVVVSPIGFISDHVEVVWDLDHEAADTARELGLAYTRAATPGIHPEFVAMIRELVVERMSGAPRRALGTVPSWDSCPADCCPAPVRDPNRR